MITKEVLSDLQEKYNKVVKLLEDSKFDPPNAPYTSKYSAKNILLEMETSLIAKLGQDEKITAMLGAVYLYLGMVSIDTEEFSEGENYLEKCNDIIKDYLEEPQFVMISLNLYNQFGILWSDREPEKSKNYLEKAEQFYLALKISNTTPIDINEIFNIEQEASVALENMEKIYTLTLYYLAQIYGKLKDCLKSAIYCHNTLQRQLDSKDFDKIDWALNSATLSQFFLEQEAFKQARHHLAAASHVLKQYEIELNSITEKDEEYRAKLEIFKHRSADVSRCWAKYGLILLLKSKERLLKHSEGLDEACTLSQDLAKMNVNEETKLNFEEVEGLKFKDLDLLYYERQVADRYVLTIQDARLVFLNIQTWLQQAALFYTLESLASDYIEIVQDKTQMYLNLLFFEDSMENQAKLHKRRVDLLENVLGKVNPKFYMQYCRQLWYELAQTYFDILNIKMDKLRELDERPSPQMLIKINHLVEKSIANFTHFLNSFKEDEIKDKIPENYEKPYLLAHFHIAALHGKFVTLDKAIQLKHTEASYECYKKIVDYCSQHDKASELIGVEFSVCKEMVTLLPVKIAKLKQEI